MQSPAKSPRSRTGQRDRWQIAGRARSLKPCQRGHFQCTFLIFQYDSNTTRPGTPWLSTASHFVWTVSIPGGSRNIAVEAQVRNATCLCFVGRNTKQSTVYTIGSPLIIHRLRSPPCDRAVPRSTGSRLVTRPTLLSFKSIPFVNCVDCVDCVGMMPLCDRPGVMGRQTVCNASLVDSFDGRHPADRTQRPGTPRMLGAWFSDSVSLGSARCNRGGGRHRQVRMWTPGIRSGTIFHRVHSSIPLRNSRSHKAPPVSSHVPPRSKKITMLGIVTSAATGRPPLSWGTPNRTGLPRDKTPSHPSAATALM